TGHLQAVAGEDVAVVAERLRILAAALRPAPLLDAERPDGDPPGLRLDQHVQRDGAVLLAALDDVAGLDEDLLAGDVLDGEFVDVLRLVDDALLLLERLVEGQDRLALDLVLA